MMKLRIELEIDQNEAFDVDRNGEVARILDDLAKRLKRMNEPLERWFTHVLIDTNGNTVGRAIVVRDL